MLIDTHCHLNILAKSQFDRPLTPQEIESTQQFIDEALQQDVSLIINVGTSVIESENCLKLSHKFPNCYSAVGIHPNDLSDNYVHDLGKIAQLAQQPGVVAIGEIGLDYHYEGYDKQRQEYAFCHQIELALQLDKAVIVHTRDAIEDTLKILERYHKQLQRCVIHCFSENIEVANQVVAWNYYLGLGGTITYPKNEYLREVACSVPLNNIVLETDTPYLPPQVIRGKKNSPAQIATIAQALAQMRGITVEAVAQQTTANAKSLFNLVTQ